MQLIFFLQTLGKKTPLHEEFSDILEHLVPICKSFIKGGTSKQAKHAVKCLYINTASADESVFAGKFNVFLASLRIFTAKFSHETNFKKNGIHDKSANTSTRGP